MVTALGYINTVEGSNPLEGGTSMPNLNFTVPAVARRLLVFHLTYPGTGTKHVDALHAGTPVISGEKWAFNLWFHDRPHGPSVQASQRMQQRDDSGRQTNTTTKASHPGDKEKEL